MFTEAQRAQLQAGAKEWGIDLDAQALDRFGRFAELLEEGNQRLNLTRIAPDEVVPLHFLDSLSPAAVLTPSPGAHLLDVGTGAGFPGVPLALAFPPLRVTLLDSTRKRLAFLDAVIAELGLTNAQTLHGRAEEIGRDPRHREQYEFVTARAVAKRETLAAWLLPLVRPGGVAVAYKSRAAGEEIAAAAPIIASLGGALEPITEVTLPGTDIARKLVLLRKIRSTPLRAPRALRRKGFPY